MSNKEILKDLDKVFLLGNRIGQSIMVRMNKKKGMGKEIFLQGMWYEELEKLKAKYK